MFELIAFELAGFIVKTKPIARWPSMFPALKTVRFLLDFSLVPRSFVFVLIGTRSKMYVTLFRFLHCTEEDLQPFVKRLNDKVRMLLNKFAF